jgi:hypothetical protein
MSLTADNSGSGRRPPTQCDICGGAVRLAIIVPHPHKAGQLRAYECTDCELPTVRYMPTEP